MTVVDVVRLHAAACGTIPQAVEAQAGVSEPTTARERMAEAKSVF